MILAGRAELVPPACLWITQRITGLCPAQRRQELCALSFPAQRRQKLCAVSSPGQKEPVELCAVSVQSH